MYQEYKRGPAIKLGEGGDYSWSWPDGSDERETDTYEFAEDDPTPVDEVKATITPDVNWERIMMVGLCVSYFGFGFFVGWIIA